MKVGVWGSGRRAMVGKGKKSKEGKEVVVGVGSSLHAFHHHHHPPPVMGGWGLVVVRVAACWEGTCPASMPCRKPQERRVVVVGVGVVGWWGRQGVGARQAGGSGGKVVVVVGRGVVWNSGVVTTCLNRGHMKVFVLDVMFYRVRVCMCTQKGHAPHTSARF